MAEDIDVDVDVDDATLRPLQNDADNDTESDQVSHQMSTDEKTTDSAAEGDEFPANGAVAAAKDRPSRVFDITLQSPTGHLPTGNGASASAMTSPMTPSTSDAWSMSSSTDGNATLCYGDERLMLSELGRKFYNRRALSDVKLRVGDRVYRCHKLLLALSSDVLERMLCSADWNDAVKQEVELYEEPECQRIFGSFIEFMYTCHVPLTPDTALPMLVLADKYNVVDLRDVCIRYARTNVIPKLQLKDVFHVWFQYATRCRHRALIGACVSALSERMDDVAASTEWESEWLSLDLEQLVEFIRSSELTVKDEWDLWQAVVRWLESSRCPGRVDEKSLSEILPHIRFSMMTADQLCELERSPIIERFAPLFVAHIHRAYKYHSLSLAARASMREFSGPTFLLRNYTETRWDKRLVIQNYSSYSRCSEVALRFTTRASAVPPQSWEWELKVYPKGFTSTSEDCRMVLYSNLILDHARPVEFQLSVVDDQRSLVTVTGRKNFCKNRYTADTEMEKKLSVADLTAPNSPYLVNDSLILQVALRPSD